MAEAIREIIRENEISHNYSSLKNIEILGGRYQKNGLSNLGELMQCLPLKVLSINTKGKFCWIELDQHWYISFTFGMSGAIYYEPTEGILHDYSIQNGKSITREEYMKHFHVKFETTNNKCFYYGDIRRFGTITIAHNRSVLDKKLSELGPDMLTGPPITDEEFIRILRQPKFNTKNICKTLMSQKPVSGIGNYIKSEILYECHINPWALVSDIDDQTLIHLHHSIREIALNAYRGHGATLYTYSGTRREKGTFQNLLKVYGKDVDPYGNKVIQIHERISPDKRTTHYVPSIQTIGNQRDPPMITPPHLMTLHILTPPKRKLVIKMKTNTP